MTSIAWEITNQRPAHPQDLRTLGLQKHISDQQHLASLKDFNIALFLLRPEVNNSLSVTTPRAPLRLNVGC